MLLQNRYEPIAVNERLRLCFTLSIAERPYKLGSRAVRIGPAHQIAVRWNVSYRPLSSRVRTGLSGWSPASSRPSTVPASYA